MADLFGDDPPHERHPVTGVKLNVITKKRPALSFIDAVTAHVMRFQGVTYTDIVQKLGTNANRIGEVFRGDVYPTAQTEAYRLLTSG